MIPIKIDPAGTVEAVGNALDKLFTSDEEREQAKAVMTRLRQAPGALQVELNKVEAAHKSVLVAGWRPWIGWMCGLGLANVFLINPWLQWFTGAPGPSLPVEAMMELVIAMLGLSGLRTYEKLKGKA